jgi:hypothetical protein
MVVSFNYCMHPEGPAVAHSPKTSTSVRVPMYTCPLKTVGVGKVVNPPIEVLRFLLL